MRDLQAAPRTPGIKPPLWRDLNIFVAALVIASSVGGMVIFAPVSMLLKMALPARLAEMLGYVFSHLLVAGLLGYWWWKHGLSPRERNPARELRFQWGHGLLAFFNIALVAMYVLPLLGGLSWLPRLPRVGGLLVALVSLAPVGLLLGLALVWSSRGQPAAFADTVSGAPAGSRPRTSAGWSALAPPPPRVSVLAVLFGLVSSSSILYIFGVFGFIAFAGSDETEKFKNVVLPIVGGCYVLYVSVVIILFLKRRMSAVWVAWAPFLIVTILGPSLQLLRGLWR